MFGRKKEPKKKIITTPAMIHDKGLPNFDKNCIIYTQIDEGHECVKFTYAQQRKEVVSATLPFEKISNIELGEKGNTVGNRIINPIAGSTADRLTPFVQTIKITYFSDGQKEIYLSDTSEFPGGCALMQTHIGKNLNSGKTTEAHIDL